MTDTEWVEDFAKRVADSNEIRLRRVGGDTGWIGKPNLARRKMLAEVIAAGLLVVGPAQVLEQGLEKST
jgi:hypothetical protein